jgi:hypothetical protein
MARNCAVGLIAKEVLDPLRCRVALARSVANRPVAGEFVAAKLSKVADKRLRRERDQVTARVASVDDGATAATRTRLAIGRRTATGRCCARSLPVATGRVEQVPSIE